MIAGQNLTALLHAVATQHTDRALNVVMTDPDIEDDLRADLRNAITSNKESGDKARALGDVFRDRDIDQFLVNECYRLAFYLSEDWEMLSDNPLYAFFAADKAAHVLDKWVHYFPIYTRHLERFRGRPVSVLEVGVYRGGGLRMLAKYLGPQAKLVGLDIDEAAVRSVRGRFPIVLGDQADPDVLIRLSREYGPFDVVIDDGGHTMNQQIVTAQTLFPLIADAGVLLVEDTHTSYWTEFGGGLHEPASFVEWAKQRVDDLHSRHHAGIDRTTDWATDLDGIHFYDSVVLFEKSHRFRPFNEIAGTASYLFGDRFSEGIGVELLATRDQALHDRDEMQARLAEFGPLAEIDPADVAAPTEEMESPRLRVELQRARRQLADIDGERAATAAELERTQNQLLESWQQVHTMRKTFSWRLTAPLRAVRREQLRARRR